MFAAMMEPSLRVLVVAGAPNPNIPGDTVPVFCVFHLIDHSCIGLGLTAKDAEVMFTNRVSDKYAAKDKPSKNDKPNPPPGDPGWHFTHTKGPTS